MRYNGSCPHCGHPFESITPPPAFLTCPVCAVRSMVTIPVPEQAAAGEVVELALLPCKEPPGRAVPLAQSRLRRPLLVAVLAFCVLAAIFGMLGGLHLVVPDSAFTQAATAAFGVILGLLLFALPLAAALSATVVWVLFRGQRGAIRFDLLHSTLVVIAGLATLIAAGTLAVGLARGLELAAGSPAFQRWSVSLSCSLVAGLTGGWVTQRLSPYAPYRHALGVGLVLVLAALAYALLVVRTAPALALGALLYALYIPLLLLGVRLGLRFGAAPSGPRGSA